MTGFMTDVMVGFIAGSITERYGMGYDRINSGLYDGLNDGIYGRRKVHVIT